MIPLTRHLSSGCLTCIILIYEDIISIWVELLGPSPPPGQKSQQKPLVMSDKYPQVITNVYGIMGSG